MAKEDGERERIWASNRHAGHRVPLAWVRLLATSSELIQEMSARLLDRHGLTINDYEALLHLSWAPEGRLRRVELAASVHLTAGGVTRLLKGLEREGLVESRRDAADARVVEAQLTEAGSDRLAEAARSHAADIDSAFTLRLSTRELVTLEGLLAKLAGPADEG